MCGWVGGGFLAIELDAEVSLLEVSDGYERVVVLDDREHLPRLAPRSAASTRVDKACPCGCVHARIFMYRALWPMMQPS